MRKTEKPENNYITDKYFHGCSQNYTKDTENIFIHSFIADCNAASFSTVGRNSPKMPWPRNSPFLPDIKGQGDVSVAQCKKNSVGS
jgi:hypothetical protein